MKWSSLSLIHISGEPDDEDGDEDEEEDLDPDDDQEGPFASLDDD